MADRSLGTGATWAALSSTTIGGSTTLVLASMIAARGLPALWLDLSGVLGLLALGLWLAPKIRATGAVTIAEVIGRFYGGSVRRIAAFLVILAEIVWFSLLTQATQTVVSAVTPWSSTRVLILTAALFVLYTMAGGQRAVVRTDLFQLGLMVVTLIGIATPLAVLSLRRTGLPKLNFPTGPGFTWLDVLSLLALVGLPHAVGSDVWSKLLSARDETVARRAALGAAASKLVFGLATATIALAGIGAGFGGTATLFPRTVFALCGPALAPLLLVALIATMQSSSDSVLLSAAAATLNDLLPQNREGPRRTALRSLLVVTYGALGLALALALHDVLETFRLGYTLFASGLILPTLAAFVPRLRIAPLFAGAAMLAGGAAAMLERFLHPAGLDPVLVGLAVNAAVLTLGLFFRGNAASSLAGEAQRRADDAAARRGVS
ncbi:MAG: hypothetical protein ABIT01_05695 [Thermoanaerobaculia bacterium]